ncbi:hypothetical protein EYF80_061279 [Liparis tanakae]|uniref:Uncharacterized protein n=1 Tax=Liparis tanakae TaxID=230148 RepID=A0A4Z2EIX1_9TELE|nr:hypothetical protein EYF80_061279 [Liparis tanakae]
MTLMTFMALMTLMTLMTFMALMTLMTLMTLMRTSAMIGGCVAVPPRSGLALPVRHQEDHGLLLADVGHDGGQLVDVAAVEVLRLPQVQDQRAAYLSGEEEEDEEDEEDEEPIAGSTKSTLIHHSRTLFTELRGTRSTSFFFCGARCVLAGRGGGGLWTGGGGLGTGGGGLRTGGGGLRTGGRGLGTGGGGLWTGGGGLWTGGGAGPHSPLQLQPLGQQPPVGAVGAGRVQAAADLLADEVRDLEGARPGQRRRRAVHQQELRVHGPAVLWTGEGSGVSVPHGDEARRRGAAAAVTLAMLKSRPKLCPSPSTCHTHSWQLSSQVLRLSRSRVKVQCRYRWDPFQRW